MFVQMGKQGSRARAALAEGHTANAQSDPRRLSSPVSGSFIPSNASFLFRPIYCIFPFFSQFGSQTSPPLPKASSEGVRHSDCHIGGACQYLSKIGMEACPGLVRRGELAVWTWGREASTGVRTGSRRLLHISASAFTGPGCLRNLILLAS